MPIDGHRVIIFPVKGSNVSQAFIIFSTTAAADHFINGFCLTFFFYFFLQCEACTSLLNGSYSLPPEVDQMLLVPRVMAAFHMRLRRNVNVAAKTFLELKKFYQVKCFISRLTSIFKSHFVVVGLFISTLVTF